MIENISQLAPYLADEDKARELFEHLHWPDGLGFFAVSEVFMQGRVYPDAAEIGEHHPWPRNLVAWSAVPFRIWTIAVSRTQPELSDASAKLQLLARNGRHKVRHPI